jgi:hypothetical protein
MLKKILVLVFAFTTFYSYQAFSQRIMGEAIVGFNMSKVEGDLVNNGSLKFQKQGLNIGVGAIIPVNDIFSINLQTLFSQKGANKKYGPHPDSAMPYYKTRMDYAEVPILFQYHDKNGLTIGTGISYSRLVRIQWTVNGRVISSSTSDGYYARDNFDWIADFKYRVWKNAHINLRYQYGLNSIWSGEDEDLLVTQAGEKQSTDQRHSVFSIRLIWVFGMEQSKDVRNGVE